MKDRYTKPLYTIGITAEMLKVCVATLRIWEKKGLIRPSRIGRNRFYSECDVERLERIKDLLQNKRVNIEGVKNILISERCWDIKNCRTGTRKSCPVYLKAGPPGSRTL